MIWIIFVLLAGLAIFIAITTDVECDFGASLGCVFVSIAAAASLIAGIVLMCCVVEGETIDERIAMYEAENMKIEEQITDIVENYKKYEGDVFGSVGEENAMAIVTLYPELKSDSLVSKQIDVYVENNDRIKELKIEKISLRPARWWLYFGS